VIPFTLAHTSLAAARVGDRVNLEGDVLGKYVSRLLSTVLESGGVPIAAARARA
jgi:riboflavin synthase